MKTLVEPMVQRGFFRFAAQGPRGRHDSVRNGRFYFWHVISGTLFLSAFFCSYNTPRHIPSAAEKMRENPFEPPNSVSEPHIKDSPWRKRGRIAYYQIMFLMAVPALYNYLEFDAHALMGSSLPPQTVARYRLTNLVAMVLGSIVVFFFGLRFLERLSLTIRGLLARDTDRTAWQELLYQAVYRASILSIPGAVLWLLWVFGFYEWRMNFVAISWAIGVPAHLLGACVYLPLIAGWYRLAHRNNGREVDAP